MTIGLTKFIEGVVIDSIGSFQFGRNQFDLADPECISLIKELAAFMNVNTTTHQPYLFKDDKLTTKNRNDEVVKFETYIFVNRQIDIEFMRLEQIIGELLLTNSGINGKFPFILPSRDKAFR